MTTQPPCTLEKPTLFPLYGYRLIDASAGTGKTYTLAAFYVRLVLGHGGDLAFDSEGLLPPEILVLTFTNAATAELRDRIRKRLIEAAAAFRGQNSPAHDAFLQVLIKDYPPEKHQHCAAKLEIAAQWMDESAIFTIHGWCQRMLSEHAFDSGALFDETLDNNSEELLKQIARDYWREFVYPMPAKILPAMIRSIKSPDDLLKKVKIWLNHAGEKIELRVNGAVLPEASKPTEFLDTLGGWIDEYQKMVLKVPALIDAGVLNQLDQAIEAQLLDKRSFKVESWKVDKVQLIEWSHSSTAATYIWALKNIRFIKKYSSIGIKKKISAPLFDHLLVLYEHLEKFPDFSLPMRRHVAEWIELRYQQLKKQDGLLNFNDLLVRLHSALEEKNSDLARAIREQFPVAMIDEFQDTDRLQIEIFQKVYPEIESQNYGLFLVGDPKQSIYSFRGADIHSYLDVKGLTQGRHYQLDTNYRSTKSFVNSVNQLFLEAENQENGAFGLKSTNAQGDVVNPMLFDNVKAKGRHESLQIRGGPVASLNYWFIDQPPSAINKDQYRRTMASACAEQISQALMDETAGFVEDTVLKKLKPKNIAILVSTGSEADLVRKELQLRNVNSVYLSEGESVFATDEAQLLLSWLRAVHQPANESLLRSALIQPKTMQSDVEINGWINVEEGWDQLTAQLRIWHKSWNNQGVLAMLRYWLHFFQLPARWLDDVQAGERTLTNALHLAEILQKESMNRDGPTALLRWFTEMVNGESGDKKGTDEVTLRLESDDDLVRVVTIHKSKGLQYPLVFIPFVCAYRKVKSNDNPHYYDGSTIVYDLEPDTKINELADTERLQEDIRKLYVALTRAEHACWLGLASFGEGQYKKCHLDKSAIGRLLGITKSSKDPIHDLKAALKRLPWSQAKIIDSLSIYRDTTVASVQHAKKLKGPLFKRKDSWWISSYSTLETGPMQGEEAASTSAEDILDDPGERGRSLPDKSPKGTIHTLPAGAETGTFLHNLLELGGSRGFKDFDLSQGALDETLKKRLLGMGWIEEDYLASLQAWMEQMLTVPLVHCGAEVTLSSLQQLMPEMEFWMGVEETWIDKMDQLIRDSIWPGERRPSLKPTLLNGILKGFIDLAFQAEDNRYWVVDYKSNRLGEDSDAYNEEMMKKAMLHERYDVQATLYLLALHRLLKVRLPGYEDEPTHYLGGCFYWFIREPEQGQLKIPISLKLLDDLDQLFSARQGDVA